jgi:recombination protein RecA
MAIPKKKRAAKPHRAKLSAKLQKQLRDKYGEGSVQDLSSASSNISMWFDTGCVPLNLILTGDVNKGIPSGRMIELFGAEASGKTTICASIMRNTQAKEGLPIIIDTESSFTKDQALRHGLDIHPDKLIYFEECFLEPILDAIQDLVVQLDDTPVTIVWDTVASTPTKKERGRDVGEASFGAHARALSEGMRKIAKPLAESNAALIICNQRKEGAMANPFASENDKDATLGGHAIRFHAHARIKLELAKTAYSTLRGGRKKEVGFDARIKTVKNKAIARGCRAMLVFRSDIGKFDNALSCARTLQQWKAIPKPTGTTITFDGKKYSERQWRETYNTNEKIRDAVHKLCEETFVSMYGIDSKEEE